MSIKIVFTLYPGIAKWFPREVLLHLNFPIHQGDLHGVGTGAIKVHFHVEKGRPITFYRTTSLESPIEKETE